MATCSYIAFCNTPTGFRQHIAARSNKRLPTTMARAEAAQAQLAVVDAKHRIVRKIDILYIVGNQIVEQHRAKT